jgi:hypothetical protein
MLIACMKMIRVNRAARFCHSEGKGWKQKRQKGQREQEKLFCFLPSLPFLPFLLPTLAPLAAPIHSLLKNFLILL